MNSLPAFSKTRIAPTPSGFLHLGNLYSFAVTAWLARQTGAKILLRIDDLDSGRIREPYIRDIFDTLHFMEIPWDEGPIDYEDFNRHHSQLHRAHLYNGLLGQLTQTSQVFGCSCSRAQTLSAGLKSGCAGDCKKQPASLDIPDRNWRLVTDDRLPLELQTITGSVVTTSLPPDMHDFVIRRKDGAAAYQLASLADDLYFGVDLVVRGEDLWASTLAQAYLATLLPSNTFQQARFHHHSLLRGSDSRKLSKSAGAGSIKYLREQGYRSPAVYALIANAAGLTEPVRNWVELGEKMRLF